MQARLIHALILAYNNVAEGAVKDFNDNTLEINTLNSNGLDPKAFASYNTEMKDTHAPEKCCLGFDIVSEQDNDTEISDLKILLINGKAGKSQERKHILLEDVLYFIGRP